MLVGGILPVSFCKQIIRIIVDVQRKFYDGQPEWAKRALVVKYLQTTTGLNSLHPIERVYPAQRLLINIDI